MQRKPNPSTLMLQTCIKSPDLFLSGGGGGAAADAFTYPILIPLVPLFWISGEISFVFQSQSGFCLICILEAKVMYIP